MEGPNGSLRARLRTDAEGRFHFWTLLPTAYPVPTCGRLGEMLTATSRHPMRPAHVHFMSAAPAQETLVTHVFVAGDDYLDSDTVFGVKQDLIAEFTCAPEGYRVLQYGFALKRLG